MYALCVHVNHQLLYIEKRSSKNITANFADQVINKTPQNIKHYKR